MHSLISENVSLDEYSQFLPAEIEKKIILLSHSDKLTKKFSVCIVHSNK